MKIGICGNIDLTVLAQELDDLMPTQEIIAGRPGAYKDELRSAIGEFASLDMCIVALDWRAYAPELYEYVYGDDPTEMLACFQRSCDELGSILDEYRTRCTARMLVFTPVTDPSATAGFIGRLLRPSAFEVFAECQNRFNALCRSRTDVYPVDIDDLAGRFGRNHAFDLRTRCLAGRPYTAAFSAEIAKHIARICGQFLHYPIKCLVLDLDNTLWGGIAGEEGLDKVVLSDTGEGGAYKELQSAILTLHKKGVLLAVCSKNNTCDALDIMERHPHMLIRPSMIASFRINWDDKPKNVLEISHELNIGLDAMLFIDDSEVEREMMRTVLPEVEILGLPEDPFRFAETLRDCSRVWPTHITNDDLSKGRFIAQQQHRDEQRKVAASIEAYLRGSDITVTIAPANVETLPRITQLFAKTNQFNLTTIRYSQAELEKLMGNRDVRLLSMAMSDRFGEYGIVGAALVVGDTIDAFVLSCRVFGRQVERAFVVQVAERMKAAGVRVLRGRYRPSERNAMTKEFYASAGFTKETEAVDETVWRLDLSGPPIAGPEWVTVRAL